jgi:hypothetical protein
MDTETEKLVEANMKEVKEMEKSLITSGFKALMEQNGGLPLGT